MFQKGHNSTKITIHRLAAPNPIQTHNLPFSVRSLLWNASAQVQKGCYSLIAITQTWSVVEFGDNVRPTEGEGVKGQGISAQGPSAQKPSLFADIFGSLSLSGPATGSSRAHVETWRGKEGAAVFDGPAYLLPPLGSLYTTLMDGFLKVRQEPSAGDSKDGDEDIDMEDAAVDEQPPASSVAARTVEKEEIETLVALFKQNSLSGELSFIQIIIPALSYPSSVSSNTLQSSCGEGEWSEGQRVRPSCLFSHLHSKAERRPTKIQGARHAPQSSANITDVLLQLVGFACPREHGKHQKAEKSYLMDMSLSSLCLVHLLTISLFRLLLQSSLLSFYPYSSWYFRDQTVRRSE